MNARYKYLLTTLFIVFIISFYIFEWRTNSVKVIDLAEVIAPQSECKPQQQVCKFSNEKFFAEVELDKNIFYLKPFKVTVRTAGKENDAIKSVYIDFKMKEMEMGVNRFKLINKGIINKNINWEGKALLPICVTGRIDWISEVEVVTDNAKYIFSFPMEVKKANS